RTGRPARGSRTWPAAVPATAAPSATNPPAPLSSPISSWSASPRRIVPYAATPSARAWCGSASRCRTASGTPPRPPCGRRTCWSSSAPRACLPGGGLATGREGRRRAHPGDLPGAHRPHAAGGLVAARHRGGGRPGDRRSGELIAERLPRQLAPEVTKGGVAGRGGGLLAGDVVLDVEVLDGVGPVLRADLVELHDELAVLELDDAHALA